MMESKTERNTRLKAMRKKYGLGEFKGKKKSSGGRMAKKKYHHSSSGGIGFGKGDFLSAALEGIGAAALAKRFLGMPLGTFTGAATGAGYAMLKKKNILAAGLGGYIHDNIGNLLPSGQVVGGSGASGSLYL